MRSRLLALCLIVAATPARAAPTTVTYVRPVHGPVTRHFEPPPDQFSAGHRGIDLATPVGTPVMAAADGTVAFAGQVGGQLFVSIDHADGLRSTYSFLSVVLVKAKQGVTQGQEVALSGPGATGESPNLHFGLKRGSTYLDPEPYLVAGLRTDESQVIRLTA